MVKLSQQKLSYRCLTPHFINLGLIVCPSRELAKQILETVEHFAECLVQQGMPRIKSCLIIGGTPVNQSLEIINRHSCLNLTSSLASNLNNFPLFL